MNNNLVSVEKLQSELYEVNSQLDEVEVKINKYLQKQQQLQEIKERLESQIQQEQRAPRKDWTQTFPWCTQVDKILKNSFGLDSFRPLQREIINASLQGRDVLALLPSGGGKSLCYQLTALMIPGITVVISPLLALIEDQVLALNTLGIKAFGLTSATDKKVGSSVEKSLDDPKCEIKLLYLTPEKIVKSKRLMGKLEKVYRQQRLVRIAIDEAHCCSQWGNDFRPDYRKLGILKQQFPDTPILALTATASHQVCEDMKTILKIYSAEFFQSSVNRPNLCYEVRQKSEGVDISKAICDWITKNQEKDASGIVYCLTRKDCETLALQMRHHGIRTRYYHADMESEERSSVYNDWVNGEVQVIVATIAFGMGINKTDVRFVIHQTMSKSMENYYQESGRAGRDGKKAHCILFYRFQDVLKVGAMVCTEVNWHRCLDGMVSYVSRASHSCARAIIQKHFGEPPSHCNQMCAVCQQINTKAAQQDVTDQAKAIINAIQSCKQTEKRMTIAQILKQLQSSGKGGKLQATQFCNEAVIAQLYYDGYLRLDFGHTAYTTNSYLKCSSTAFQIEKGVKRLYLPVLVKHEGSSEKKQDVLKNELCKGGKEPPLLTILKHLRAQAAAEFQLDPHLILSDDQINQLFKVGQERSKKRQKIFWEDFTQILGETEAKQYAHSFSAILQKQSKVDVTQTNNQHKCGDNSGTTSQQYDEGEIQIIDEKMQEVKQESNFETKYQGNQSDEDEIQIVDDISQGSNFETKSQSILDQQIANIVAIRNLSEEQAQLGNDVKEKQFKKRKREEEEEEEMQQLTIVDTW